MFGFIRRLKKSLTSTSNSFYKNCQLGPFSQMHKFLISCLLHQFPQDLADLCISFCSWGDHIYVCLISGPKEITVKSDVACFGEHPWPTWTYTIRNEGESIRISIEDPHLFVSVLLLPEQIDCDLRILFNNGFPGCHCRQLHFIKAIEDLIRQFDDTRCPMFTLPRLLDERVVNAQL
jgi:hypothetical protein